METVVETSERAIARVAVIGGGCAGLLAALTLKKKIPALSVRVIRPADHVSPVAGEGATAYFAHFLHGYLEVGFPKFHELANPIWKLGRRFIWGERPSFNFAYGQTMDGRNDRRQLKPNGFYCYDCVEYCDVASALMADDKAFPRSADGRLQWHNEFGYQLEREHFLKFLEFAVGVLGVEIVDDFVEHAAIGPGGVEKLHLRSGKVEQADFFVDCSGQTSVLLGKALGEPFNSFASSLPCQRMIVGSWNRADSTDTADQTIKPYTTCETMPAGWAWRMEHESSLSAGCVYSPEFLGDHDAEAALRAKFPRLGQTHVLSFKQGMYARNWVKNVVAVGEAAGFVEPLQSTMLSTIARQIMTLADTLMSSDLLPRPSQLAMYNRATDLAWQAVRAFLATHYKFNPRLDTPFWNHCREMTDLSAAVPIVTYFQENGPDGFWGLPLLNNPQDEFKLKGFINLLVGLKAPYRRTWEPQTEDVARFEETRKQCRMIGEKGFSVREALELIRSPQWKWT